MAIDPDELHELLTVDDVAAVLKVSESWVYEHTRSGKRSLSPSASSGYGEILKPLERVGIFPDEQDECGRLIIWLAPALLPAF